ncbi:MAG: hypothetical protein ACRDJH_12590 [Thermomicrobiales bacterium]
MKPTFAGSVFCCWNRAESRSATDGQRIAFYGELRQLTEGWLRHA